MSQGSPKHNKAELVNSFRSFLTTFMLVLIVRQTEWGERLSREILDVFWHQFAPALECRPCVDYLERFLAIDAVCESRERIFSGCPDSSHTVLAGHPHGTKPPNKSLHGTPRTFVRGFGRFIFGVHELNRSAENVAR